MSRRVVISLLAAVSVSVASASLVYAADMPLKAATPAWGWTGWYFGAHVGGAFGTIETQVPGGGFAFASAPVNGFIGGGQTGYNWQTGPIVLGPEIEVSATNLKETTPCVIALVCSRSVDWLTSASGRVGFTADRALIFVKGGAAWSNFMLKPSMNFAGNALTGGSLDFVSVWQIVHIAWSSRLVNWLR